MTTTVFNNEIRPYVQRRGAFKNRSGSVFSAQYHNLYAVFSYGTHFPLYVYDAVAKQWFGTQAKHSKSGGRSLHGGSHTGDHQRWAKPILFEQDDPENIRGVSINWRSTDYLLALIFVSTPSLPCCGHIPGETTSTTNNHPVDS